MSRGQFRSRNRVGETMSFQTNSSSGTTFSPSVTFLSGSDRVSWDLGIGNGYIAKTFGYPDNNLSYTYPDGTTKTVVLRTNKLSNLNQFESPVDNLVGNLDLSRWDNLGDVFRVNQNPSLTSITHTPSTQVFSKYLAYSCDLTGNHDMSGLSGLGGNLRIYSNSALTGITHTSSTETFTDYYAHQCNLTGNHDMSGLSGLGGEFIIHENPLLTSITNPASTQVFSKYYAYSCDLTGNHDMSGLSGLGGQFIVLQNQSLTSITHTTSTQVFSTYWAYLCNLKGNHDMSMLPGLGGSFSIHSNSLLTGITHTASTETFGLYWAYSCDLDYVNFLPLSGASINGDIRLEENSMSVTDVNHILVDFNNISTNLNPSGWTGTTLDISGTNAAPDSSSGGFNGIAALSSLTGGTNNWTITTS